MPKRYPQELKFQVVLEVLTGEKSVGQVAKIYGVHPNSVNGWKQDRRIAELEQRQELFYRRWFRKRKARPDMGTAEGNIVDMESVEDKESSK